MSLHVKVHYNNTVTTQQILGWLMDHCASTRDIRDGGGKQMEKFCTKYMLCWELLTSINLKRNENRPTKRAPYFIYIHQLFL
jgi:hypothetical protein